MSDEPQNSPDTSRARTHKVAPHGEAADAAPAGPPPGPAGETETHAEVVETVTQGEAEPVGTAGEAMVALLARRAALPRKVIDAIERGLEARKWSWDPGTKSRVYDHDHGTQLKAATLYLEYVVGRPAERELVVTDGKGQGFSLDDLMASSALRRALARRLALADASVPKPGQNY